MKLESQPIISLIVDLYLAVYISRFLLFHFIASRTPSSVHFFVLLLLLSCALCFMAKNDGSNKSKKTKLTTNRRANKKNMAMKVRSEKSTARCMMEANKVD
jgi:membrane-bound acyltransferase YfiQ involved in biofilm formation